jgi:hypothetical protein
MIIKEHIVVSNQKNPELLIFDLKTEYHLAATKSISNNGNMIVYTLWIADENIG